MLTITNFELGSKILETVCELYNKQYGLNYSFTGTNNTYTLTPSIKWAVSIHESENRKQLIIIGSRKVIQDILISAGLFILDSNDDTQLKLWKKAMFDYLDLEFGNPYGTENYTI
jgi:hypothetical protein